MIKRIIFIILAILIMTGCNVGVQQTISAQPPTKTSEPATATQLKSSPALPTATKSAPAAAALTPAPTLPKSTAGPLTMTNPAFSNNVPIPKKFTCDAENLSPAIEWSNVPEAALSLALIADDPDAPGGTWVHWVLYNIPPTLKKLPEGIAKGAEISGIGLQGLTSFGDAGYGGPCPPQGSPHRYYFRLYALDLAPNLAAGMNSGKLQSAIKGHILAEAVLMGTYQR